MVCYKNNSPVTRYIQYSHQQYYKNKSAGIHITNLATSGTKVLMIGRNLPMTRALSAVLFYRKIFVSVQYISLLIHGEGSKAEGQPSVRCKIQLIAQNCPYHHKQHGIGLD